MKVIEEFITAGRQRPDIDDAFTAGRDDLFHAQRNALEFHWCRVEIFHSDADGAIGGHAYLARLEAMILDCDQRPPPPLPKLASVSGSNAFSPSIPVDDPTVKFPKMYLVSTSWNAPASCARAANVETKIVAAVTAGTAKNLAAAELE